MKPSSYLPVGLLALACLVCGWFIWSEYTQLVELRAANVGGETEASLRKDIWRNQREITDLKKRMNPPSAVSVPGGPAMNRMRMSNLQGVVGILRDPEVRRLQGTVMQGYSDQMFAALYKQLNLSPEKLAAFRGLILERLNSAEDVLVLASDQGIDPQADPKAFQKLMQDSSDAIDAKTKALLGDADFQKTQEYVKTAPQRGVATQLQQALSYSSSPLTDAQASQVATLLAQNPVPGKIGSPGAQEVMTAGSMGIPLPGGEGAPISDSALNQASGFLSEPQVAALRQIQAVQQTQQQLQKVMIKSMKAGGG